MVIFKKIADIKNYIASLRRDGAAIGFVPTMGALHNGHLSLIARAKNEGAIVICSIFVNPAQFNDPSDFLKYPKTIAEDIAMLTEAKCDVLFLPEVAEIYPNGFDAAKQYHFGALEEILEGAHRPGHFRGVGMVVAILLQTVQPDALYLGQKDFQQCLIIGRLLELMHEDKSYCNSTGAPAPTQIVVCPTNREPDGLAMSSRNRRLTDPQRMAAAGIYRCLVAVQSKKNIEKFDIVRKECEDILLEKGIQPEYIALAARSDLRLLADYEENTEMVALIAAKVGEVRLIDNIFV
jgi:pantoate--beta-alanine ligase